VTAALAKGLQDILLREIEGDENRKRARR
jgi:hypothetical protein